MNRYHPSLVSRTGCAGFGAALALVLAGLAAAPAPAQTARGAVDVVLKQFGRDYENRLVAVSGESGGPQPARWHVFALDLGQPGQISHFVVEEGRLAGASILDAARSARISGPVLRWDQVRIDSDAVFQTANAAAIAARVGFDSLDYKLALDPQRRRPAYEVQLRNRPGQVVGLLSIDANDGQVVRREFPQRPRSPERAAAPADRAGWQSVREEMNRAAIGFGEAVRDVRGRFQR